METERHSQAFSPLTPDTSVQYLKGVGPKRAAQLAKLGIGTVGDLLNHYPRRYIDFTQAYSPAQAPLGTECVVKASLLAKLGVTRIAGGRLMCRATAEGNGELLNLTWFNSRFAYDALQIDEEYYFIGRVTQNGRHTEMASPAVRTEAQATGRPLAPIYPQTEGLNSNFIAGCVQMALSAADALPDPLPEALRAKYHLMPLPQAIRAIHLPKSMEQAEAARQRLVFEELFTLQCGMLLMGSGRHTASGYPMKAVDLSRFWASLPYRPTGAQQRAVSEIVADMTGTTPMDRLLQGDVGSGKTLVAAAAIFSAARNGCQSALMAPTEILATQHADGLQDMLAPFGIRVALLTGSTKGAERKRVLQAIASGEAQLVVGTHALISDGVEFNRLGLVVVDEQHRFGVKQRGQLAAKANAPHLLVMSATPIPRTLALLLYGDLKISVLDELPPGRTPVKTWFAGSEKRAGMYAYLYENYLSKGHQAYVVCPLIGDDDDSEAVAPKSEMKAAKTYVEEIARPLLPGCRIGLMHGKMKPAEKASVMDAFKAGELDVLVSTTVIEVGVDVPNATAIVIENAERYGLSALHQLRGRVGRGSTASCCILVSDYKSGPAAERLRFLCRTTDGFQVAQYDLDTRGPGDFLGTAQHGIPTLQVANLSADARILSAAQKEAQALLACDPRLEGAEHAALAAKAQQLIERSGPLN